MSFSIFFLVLGAALLHAIWNIIVKGGENKLFETALNALGGGVGAALFLPFLPLPDSKCLGLLALSCLFHLLYYFCVATTYKIADLSLGYTVMRGAAPIFTALVLSLAGTSLGLNGWCGILLLCSGILILAVRPVEKNGATLKGLAFALRTSLVITCYTLADGFGARVSGHAISYACWIFFLNIFPINLLILCKHGGNYIDYFRRRAVKGLPGGFCSLASYGIVIWAMTCAPIPFVAALRETSVIFGMVLAMLFLGEKLTFFRVCAIVLVVSGAIITRLGT